MRCCRRNLTLTPGCLAGVRCEIWDFRSRISLQAAWLEWDVRCEIAEAEYHSRLRGWSEMWDVRFPQQNLTPGCLAGVRCYRRNLTSHSRLPGWSEIWDVTFLKTESHSALPGWSEMWHMRFPQQNLFPGCLAGMRCCRRDLTSHISLQAARLEWDVRCDIFQTECQSRLPGWRESGPRTLSKASNSFLKPYIPRTLSMFPRTALKSLAPEL